MDKLSQVYKEFTEDGYSWPHINEQGEYFIEWGEVQQMLSQEREKSNEVVEDLRADIDTLKFQLAIKEGIIQVVSGQRDRIERQLIEQRRVEQVPVIQSIFSLRNEAAEVREDESEMETMRELTGLKGHNS